MTQLNLSMKQTDIENRLVVAKGKENGGVGLGVWDQQVQTIIHKMNQQHGPTVQDSTGNYIQYPVVNYSGKEFEKACIYVYN